MGKLSSSGTPGQKIRVLFLQGQISDLPRHTELNMMSYSRAWDVNDAPAEYIDLLRKSITEIEIEITRLEGKYKMSQELGELIDSG